MPLHSKKYQKTLILAFEANSVLSRENETKIVKITHSAAAVRFALNKFGAENGYISFLVLKIYCYWLSRRHELE